MNAEKYMKHLRQDRLPHVWCPGCGNGIVLRAVVSAIEDIGLDPNKTAIISGIGCSSRATGYLNFNTLHTLHGRAIAFATGVSLARPDMKVIVLTGDGDCAAIGGNHFIHAARRNINITVVALNNNIYGMTGGQYSPTTPNECYATTSPYGNVEKPFDLSRLAITAGATYVARATAYHFVPMHNYIKKAINNDGFSFVEAIVQCPTYYGRYNKLGTAPEMMEFFKNNSISITKVASEFENLTQGEKENLPLILDLSKEKYKYKIIIGEFMQKQIPTYLNRYQMIIDNLQNKNIINEEVSVLKESNKEQ